jgi:carnitine-CoA ligase
VWKRKGAVVDDEVVLYAVADQLPVEELRSRIAQLPAFMRPVAVARVADLPRDAAAGKVQRRLLAERPVLDWVELG